MSLLDAIDDIYCEQHKILRSRVPRFEPRNGNENARVLIVLERPGPMAVAGRGSGYVSQHNNDPSARNMKKQLSESGLQPKDFCLTNIVPHVRTERAKVKNEQVTLEELQVGRERLLQIIAVMPQLEALVLSGRPAQKAFKQQLHLLDGLDVFETYHTSAQSSGDGLNPASKHYPKYQHNIAVLSSLARVD